VRSESGTFSVLSNPTTSDSVEGDVRLGEPNYSSKAKRIFGGKLFDIPDSPFIRYWDEDNPVVKGRHKRIVTVHVNVYDIGKHFIAEIDEEANPVWNSEDDAWQECDDDKEGKGYHEFQHLDTIDEVLEVIAKLKKQFPKTTHTIWSGFRSKEEPISMLINDLVRVRNFCEDHVKDESFYWKRLDDLKESDEQ